MSRILISLPENTQPRVRARSKNLEKNLSLALWLCPLVTVALYSCCVTMHRSDSQFHHLFQGDNRDVIYHRTGTSSPHRHTHHVTDNARFSLHFSDFRLELWHYTLLIFLTSVTGFSDVIHLKGESAVGSA